MSRSTTLWAGVALLALGVFFLITSIFNISFWQFCWPLGLIGVGVWLLFRPRFDRPGASSRVVLIGDLHNDQTEPLLPNAIWMGIGDVRLDVGLQQVAPGETVVSVRGFVGDLNVYVPAGIGVAVYAAGFVTDVEFLGSKIEHIAAPVEMSTPGYATAERRLRIETLFFVNDIDIVERQETVHVS